jgi:hypothetical protein
VKAHKDDGHESRIRLLEYIAEQNTEIFKKIDIQIEKIDERFNNLDSKLINVDLRLIKAETSIDHIDKTLTEIKSDLRWMLGIMITFSAIFLGVMAKGFHWY